MDAGAKQYGFHLGDEKGQDVFYGAAYKNGPKVCHIRVEKSSDLEKLKGSKYVQSDIGDSYKQVKKDLREERIVYFVGTPCQVAGLKLFLRKEYDNLLTSDLICHGTPSPEIFKLYFHFFFFLSCHSSKLIFLSVSFILYL